MEPRRPHEDPQCDCKACQEYDKPDPYDMTEAWRPSDSFRQDLLKATEKSIRDEIDALLKKSRAKQSSE